MIRWLRWSLLCRRGRLCADLHISGIVPPPDAPDVAIIEMTWTCGRCRTAYQVTALARRDGTFTEAARRRLH